MASRIQSHKSALSRLLSNLKNHRRLIVAATSCSILNKIFDLAPPVLIGLSVDVVVREENSWLAKLGFESVPSQLVLLTLISFLIWSAESLFEYFYSKFLRAIFS